MTVGVSASLCLGAVRQGVSAELSTQTGELLSTQGRVLYSKSGAPESVPAPHQALLPRDRLHTLEYSRAWVRFTDLSQLTLDELTTLEILPAPSDRRRSLLNLISGALFLFSREKPRELQIQTKHATGATLGTEFQVVAGETQTIFRVLDGRVDLTNGLGQTVSLVTGQEGVFETGKAPVVRGIQAGTLVQWWLYYPGVLDPDELRLSPSELTTLAASLTYYRQGDLLKALEGFPGYPGSLQPGTEHGAVYGAALLLAAGQVQKAGVLLEQGRESSSLVSAIRLLIASVTGATNRIDVTPMSASEWLGFSYYRQARNDLLGALAAARKSVDLSPGFAFAWVRVAELEFGFGHIGEAQKASRRGLELAPQNAEAVALRGFLLSAENRIVAALGVFEDAIRLNGGLPNAWLGQGLCRIRSGRSEAGRADLQTAAALEASRALLRSYLGKAYANSGDAARAAKELRRAKELDPGDPTAWLYSALLNREINRLNEALDDLETSKALNDNRQIYRSRLLLDLDRAVQGANLASIYADVGMTEPSVWEAGKSVNSDYANHAAHLFLADSFDAIRDPRRITLRYERPWLNELLMANLLAPVGVGALSETVSQEEYSKLFEQNGPRLSGSTSYLSNGELDSTLSQYGTFGNTGYALDLVRLSQDGYRPNEDFLYTYLDAKIKHQLSGQDTVYLQVEGYAYDAGDVFQRYDPSTYSPHRRVHEELKPITLLGYKRDWDAGSHSLLLVGYLENDFRLRDPNQPSFTKISAGQNILYPPFLVDSDYSSRYKLYLSEIQQIWQRPPFTTILGGACQAGTIRLQNRLGFYTNEADAFGVPDWSTDVTPKFLRLSAYGYENFQILEHLLVTGGLSYDYQSYPVNSSFPPVSAENNHVGQLSPKIGFIWSPVQQTSLRGSYARSLGGFSIDQDYRIEPTQVAGFNQAFYHLIPELANGPIASASYDTWGLGVDHRFPTRTYVGATAEYLTARAIEGGGAFQQQLSGGISSTVFRRNVTFDEVDLLATANQLLGQEWVLGATFRWSQVTFDSPFQGSPFETDKEAGTLDELSLYAIWSHPSGLFAKGQTAWYHQASHGSGYLFEGDDFWQVNLYLGYRFLQRRVELQLALLNLNDQNYHLNPLNLYAELPRGRTVGISLRFNF